MSLTRTHLLFAFLAGITGVAGSYAVAGYTRRFLVAPIDALVVQVTPGAIVAYVIQTIGDEGHLLHIALSVAIATGLLAVAALVGFLAAERLGHALLGVALAGVLAWGLAAVATADPLYALGAAVPVALFTAVGSAGGTAGETDPARRRVIASGAGALAFLGLSVGLGQLASDREGATGEGGVIDPAVETIFADAADRELDIAGDAPGLVSTFEEFYNVDIASFDPDVSADDWSLTLTGQVGEDVTITFEELTDMPTERRHTTLRCVGEELNGRKMDNAVWTGTPIAPLLEQADPGGECNCAMLRAADDYFVQFPVEALENGFLAWGMNGRPLPQSHGHPVRVLIPGHWGETNVKWLEEIELLDEAMDGYWEQRGWHGTGPVNTVAKLWSDTMLDDGTLEVAGHAYAGTRGIETVEVSVDGGDTWHDADLSEPLPGDDVWRQWRYVFEPEGTHEVVVRAIDGEGTLQPADEAGAYPSGASGWVSKTVNMMDSSSS